MPNGTTDNFTIGKEELFRLIESYIMEPEPQQNLDRGEIAQLKARLHQDITPDEVESILERLPKPQMKPEGRLRLLTSFQFEPKESSVTCEDVLSLLKSTEADVLYVGEDEYTSYWIHLDQDCKNIILVAPAFDNSIEGALFSRLRAMHLLRSSHAARMKARGDLNL